MCLIPHTNMWTAIQTHIMVRRLFICTRDKAYGIFNLCVVRYISLKADDVVIKKQVGPCPNLKDSSLLVRFLFICTKHETFGILNIFALSATPLCLKCYIHFGKKDFVIKNFKLSMLQIEIFVTFSVHM